MCFFCRNISEKCVELRLKNPEKRDTLDCFKLFVFDAGLLKHMAGIDFVIQYGAEIIPVETKGGEDKSAPSFKKYISAHQPAHALRFSERGYRKDGYITNLPLYLVRKTKDLL